MSSINNDSKLIELVYVAPDNCVDGKYDVTNICCDVNGFDVLSSQNKVSTHDTGFRLLRAYRKKKHRRRDVSAIAEKSALNNHHSQVVVDGKESDDVPEIPLSEMKPRAAVEPDVDILVISRKRMCINCFKRFTAFLLSTVGLSFLTIAYSVLGGFLFAAVEAPHERHVKSGVRECLDRHVTSLWEATDQFNVLHPVNWSMKAEELFRKFAEEVYKATKNKGWDGIIDEDSNKHEELQWSFAGSMLFSVTVITTIGYGNIAPKTPLGRFITIPYAVVGIPLTLLTIAHLGGFMATVFRFIYKKVIYRLCCRHPICRGDDNKRSCDLSDACYVTDQPQLVVKSTGDDPVTTPSDNVIAMRLPPSGIDSTLPVINRETAEPETVLVERRRGPYGVRLLATVSGRAALSRMRKSYKGIVEWRRGITNALYTEDNRQVQVPLYVSLLLIAGYVSVGALMFGLWETEWDFLIGSYFCFITLSTIGFGDFVPGTSLDDWSSQEKLVLCSLYLICGLALLAMCFDLMQEEIRKKFRRCGQWLGLIEDNIPREAVE